MQKNGSAHIPVPQHVLCPTVPPPPNGIFVEPITEERASRCLARIDLLNKIRDDILPHPKLEERIQLCQPSFEMPSWWQCGKHDKELLIGAARYVCLWKNARFVDDLIEKAMVVSRVVEWENKMEE